MIKKLKPTASAYITFLPDDILEQLKPLLKENGIHYRILDGIAEEYRKAGAIYAEKYMAAGYTRRMHMAAVSVHARPGDVFEASLSFIPAQTAPSPPTVSLAPGMLAAKTKTRKAPKTGCLWPEGKGGHRRKIILPAKKDDRKADKAGSSTLTAKAAKGKHLAGRRRKWMACTAPAAACVALAVSVCVVYGAMPVDLPDPLGLYTVVGETMEPVLLMDAVPEVTELVHRYYWAQEEGDADAYKATVDTASDGDLARVIRAASMIEEYQDLACYTLHGPTAGSYYVFARYGLKFDGIDTPAPGLTLLYVYPGEEGRLCILNQDAPEEVLRGAELVSENEKVSALTREAEEAYEAAVASDSELAQLEEKYLEVTSDE